MISRNGNKTPGWYLFTNGIDVFHLKELKAGQFVDSGQPYSLFGNTEKEVVDKCFVRAVKERDEPEDDLEYKVDRLTPRTKSEIISKSETTIR